MHTCDEVGSKTPFVEETQHHVCAHPTGGGDLYVQPHPRLPPESAHTHAVGPGNQKRQIPTLSTGTNDQGRGLCSTALLLGFAADGVRTKHWRRSATGPEDEASAFAHSAARKASIQVVVTRCSNAASRSCNLELRLASSSVQDFALSLVEQTLGALQAVELY